MKFNLPIIAQDDNTYVVSLEVKSHSLNSWVEFNHLTCLYFGETEDSGNTITDWNDSTELFQVILHNT